MRTVKKEGAKVLKCESAKVKILCFFIFFSFVSFFLVEPHARASLHKENKSEKSLVLVFYHFFAMVSEPWSFPGLDARPCVSTIFVFCEKNTLNQAYPKFSGHGAGQERGLQQ